MLLGGCEWFVKCCQGVLDIAIIVLLDGCSVALSGLQCVLWFGYKVFIGCC